MSHDERYVLAIDGGQSGTVCVLGTADGTVRGVGHGGPANHFHQPGGPERLRRAIERSLREALTAGGNPSHVAAIYLALTGGAQQGAEIARSSIDAGTVLAEGDPPAALAGGTFGGPGIGLIVGTGVVALAENVRGERVFRGGWGYLVGDEGGGYWLGLRAVQAAARALDGRARSTSLTDQIPPFYGKSSLRDVASAMYGHELGRPEIAALAPLLLGAAAAGDAVAGEIVSAAAGEIIRLLECTARAAGFTEERERCIVAAGGVMRPGNPLWQQLATLIDRHLPAYRLIAPRFPPVLGAFILALRAAGVPADTAVLDRIDASRASFPTLADKRRVTC